MNETARSRKPPKSYSRIAGKYKGRPRGRPLIQFSTCESGLDRLHVLGLPALRAFDHVELNLLTFLEAAEATGLDGGEVNEHVLTVLAADESITLGVVKPLTVPVSMVLLCFLYLECCAECSQDWCRQVTPVSGETAECIEPQKSNALLLYVIPLRNS